MWHGIRAPFNHTVADDISTEGEMIVDKKIIAVAAVAVLVVCGVGVLLATGDHSDKSDNGKAVRKACSPYTVKDLSGKEITLDYTFGAVATQYSGSGGPFIIMSALMGKDTHKYLVGTEGLNPNRMDMWNAFKKSMPELEKLPNLGSIGTDWDTSAVILLNPDALITSTKQKKELETNGVDVAFAKANIPIIYINLHSEEIKDICGSVRLLGKLFGKEERANELANYYESKVSAVYNKVTDILKTKERPLVYSELSIDGPAKLSNSYGNDIMWGALIYKCGGSNVQTKGYTPLESAKVLTANPDKILFTGSYWKDNTTAIVMGFDGNEATARAKTKTFFTERPGWTELKAYKNNEVYVLNHGMSREVWDFTSVMFLAKMIFPEEFKDLNPQGELKTFYDKFMPYKLSGYWFMEPKT